MGSDAVVLRRPAFHNIPSPTQSSVEELLNKKSADTEVYALHDLQIGEQFMSQRMFSNSKQAVFTPHTFRKFCDTVGVPSDLVHSEMGRGKRAQRRMIELVNDRLVTPELQGHRFLFDRATSTVEGIYGSDYRRLPNKEAFESFIAAHAMSKDLAPTITRFALEGTQMRADISYAGPIAYRDLTQSERDLFRRDDVINFGTSLANSEDTSVVFSLQEFLYRLACTNGAIIPTARGVRRVRHQGRNFYGRVAGAVLESAATSADFEGLSMLRNTAVTEEDLENFRAHVRRRFTDRIAISAIEDAQDETETYGSTLAKTSSLPSKVIRVGMIPMSMYNLWNGITATARVQNTLGARTRLEQFGGGFINGWKQFTRVAVKDDAQNPVEAVLVDSQ